MTTAHVFLLLTVLFFISTIYLFGEKRAPSKKGGEFPSPMKHRPAAILSAVLGVLSLIVAVTTNLSKDTLPVNDSDTASPEGGRFPLPAPIAAEATTGEPGPDPVEELKHQRALDAKLAEANAKLQVNPNDVVALGDRGCIYAERKSYDQAEADFRAALKINGNLAKATFDLSEMEFQQKKYDSARPGFFALESNPFLGDLSTYKVFLCDMLGGHETLAQKELDDINHADLDASYYYANIAWFLYHHQPVEGRQWLDSATYIYARPKAALYTSSLNDLGYLPIPTPQ